MKELINEINRISTKIRGGTASEEEIELFGRTFEQLLNLDPNINWSKCKSL